MHPFSQIPETIYIYIYLHSNISKPQTKTWKFGNMTLSLRRWTNPSNFQGTHVKKNCRFQIHLVMLDETHSTTGQTSVTQVCQGHEISRVRIDFLFVIWRRFNLKPRSVIIKTNPHDPSMASMSTPTPNPEDQNKTPPGWNGKTTAKIQKKTNSNLNSNVVPKLPKIEKGLNLNETHNHLNVATKFEYQRKLCLWKLQMGYLCKFQCTPSRTETGSRKAIWIELCSEFEFHPYSTNHYGKNHPGPGSSEIVFMCCSMCVCCCGELCFLFKF